MYVDMKNIESFEDGFWGDYIWGPSHPEAYLLKLSEHFEFSANVTGYIYVIFLWVFQNLKRPICACAALY